MSEQTEQLVQAIKHRASIAFFALAAGVVGGDFTDVLERDGGGGPHEHPEIAQLAEDFEELRETVNGIDKRLAELDTRESGFEARVLELLEILREKR